jgi:predicted GNAT superfamily acetyltransferase
MVNPNLWGPHGWKFIHYAALGYPNNPTLQEKNNYKFFYNNLQNILPCLKCRVHYAENIKNDPIDNHLHSNIDLFNWTVDIHNIINREYNKKIYSYDEALAIYTRNYYERYDNIYIGLLLLIVVLLVIYICKKCK